MLQFNLMKITLFLFFMIIFSSCAVNRKMMFENKKVAIDNNFSKKITVVFQDSRKDVLAGKEKVTFCGHMNSSAQIEYNIQTKSGKPLADEFSIFFSNSYNTNKELAKPVFAEPRNNKDSIINNFKNSDMDFMIFVSIYDWETRSTPLFSSIRYEMKYKLHFEIYNKNGNKITEYDAQEATTEKKGLAASLKIMQTIADDAIKKEFKHFFDSPSVKNILM